MIQCILLIDYEPITEMAAESLLEKQAEAKQGFLALSCLLLFCYNASLGLTFLFKFQLFTFCVNIEIGTSLICHLFGCCYVYGGLTLEHHQGRTNLNGKDFVVLYFIFWFEWEYILTFNRWR